LVDDTGLFLFRWMTLFWSYMHSPMQICKYLVVLFVLGCIPAGVGFFLAFDHQVIRRKFAEKYVMLKGTL